MTKEALEKEAEEYARKTLSKDCCDLKLVVYKRTINSYLAGAEPREKRIAELEQKLEQTEKDLTDYQFNYPKIKDLEKENAGLKDQHTQAKDFIKRLLATPRSIYGRDEDGELTSFFNPDYEELKKQAEQFLKE